MQKLVTLGNQIYASSIMLILARCGLDKMDVSYLL